MFLADRTDGRAIGTVLGHWRWLFWGTGVGCFSFFFWLRVLDKAEYSAFQSTLNSPIVSYRIVSYRCIRLSSVQNVLWLNGAS